LSPPSTPSRRSTRANSGTWTSAFLFDRDAALANFLIKVFPPDKARLNEPYGPKDGVMHLLNLHAAPRGLKHVMIEIRNDLIADHAGQNAWANYLVVPLAQAAIKLATPSTRS
jgi:predicted N-formylglutamate amidohydrolase